MPKIIDGQSYLTQDEAARKLKVSTRTLANWLKRKIVTPPATVRQGTRYLYAFTDKWVAAAKMEVAAYRKK